VFEFTIDVTYFHRVSDIQCMRSYLVYLTLNVILNVLDFVRACARATSHTRLRARDHYTSSTLIDGKRGASPSSLNTMLEGVMEYVNAKTDVDGGRPTTKPGDHDTLNAHHRWVILIYHV
jgi:hypothetical protein